MKRRVCCFLLGICMLCLPVQQVYAAPGAGPAAKTEEKEEKKLPHEHNHEHPVPPHEKEKPIPPHKKEKPAPPHEHDHEHPKPHELKGTLAEKPVPPAKAEKPLLPHEKENAENEVTTVTPKPTATPKPTETIGMTVTDYALKFVGNPYKYGGTSLTNGADCSGFVQSVYAQFGYSLPRTSREQAVSAGYMDITVKESALQPGDLIFYADNGGRVFHVALYIGNGNVVHAANSKKGITVSEYDYMKPYKARRVVQ